MVPMKTIREGFWTSTYTGLRVYPLDPRPEDFCIEDIAQGLSNTCRYSGQCFSFYSVAEHSWRGAKRALDQAMPALAYEFLLHDAAEAYAGDVVRPLAASIDRYREIRDGLQRVINVKFGLLPDATPECEELDARMLATEAPVMFAHNDKWWQSPEFIQPFADEWDGRRHFPRLGRTADTATPAMPAAISRSFMAPQMARRVYFGLFHELRSSLFPGEKDKTCRSP